MATQKNPAKSSVPAVAAKPLIKPASKTAPAVRKPAAKKTVATTKPVTAAKVSNTKPAAKTVIAKASAKPPVSAALKPVAANTKPTTKLVVKTEKKVEVKLKKIKQVRDSFTMPETEYVVLGQVKKTCLKAGFEIKKSDLLRIGVSLIKNLETTKLKTLLAGLTPLKVGRPKK